VGLSRHQAQAITHPARSPIAVIPESVGINNYRSVSFTTTDGINLKGWFIPPENRSVVIFVHGLGGNRSTLLDDAHMVVSHGYGALLFDLRNSGESDGALTSLGLLEANDVRAAIQSVEKQLEPGSNIALFGHSMGAAASLLAGEQAGADAIVSISSFTSIEDNVANAFETMTGLPPFPFAPILIYFAEREVGHDIAEVSPANAVTQYESTPVLFIHGAQDTLVPVSNLYALYEQANDPREFFVIEEAGHFGFRAAEPEQYEYRIIDFLDTHLQNR
jgi:alpha-beta hydrolase superfamily lysophospholipase